MHKKEILINVNYLYSKLSILKRKNIYEKKILVTGSSSGLGFAIAKDLNKKGYLVVVNGRNLNKLKKICEKEKFYGFEAGDLSKEKDAKKVSIKSYKKLKGLDAIICCVGESKSCPPNKENLKIGKKCLNKIFLLQQILSKIQKNI